MSVVGFDLGTKFCTLAVAQRGGIDVIANEASSRKTPMLVALNNDGFRFLGEAALTQYTRNIKNTISELKRLIGRDFSDQDIQDELANTPYRLCELDDGSVGVKVQYNGQLETFTPTQLTAMMLHKLKATVEAATKKSMKDVVISVPSFWTDRERRALVDASTLGGLNVLRLLNETTATGLAYGFYKKDLPEDGLKVMFFDMGYASLQVSIISFSKGKMEVLGTAWDRNLGGKHFDKALFNHFADEFKERYRIDVRENLKATRRLMQACEKAKTVLSSISSAPLNISCIMNDVDVSSSITREKFEELVAPLAERVAPPILRLLEETGLSPDQLTSIEAVGGSHRIPCVKSAAKSVLGRDFSVTCNAEESVAKGSALQCAILSPSFRVGKDYKIVDRCHFPINLTWRDLDLAPDASDTPTEIFKAGIPLPGVKMITFPKGKPFEMRACYGESAGIPEGHSSHIASFTVSEVPLTSAGEQPKVRVKVRLNDDGIFDIAYVQMVESVEEEDSASAPSSTPPSPSPAAEQATGGAAPSTPPATDDGAGEPMDVEPSAEPPVKKKARRVVRKEVSVERRTTSLSGEALAAARAQEEERIARDETNRLTEEAKDQLERYIYEVRGALDEAFAAFVDPSVKDTFRSTLNGAEDWLYGDGEEASLAEFKQRLNDLTAVGEPIRTRQQEALNRPDALAMYKSTVERVRDLAYSADPKYEHIGEEERAKIHRKIKESEEVVLEKAKQSDTQDQWLEPLIKCSDITQWAESIEKFARPIMNKPKPKPPAPKKDESAKDEQTKENAEATTTPPKEEGEVDESEPMDTEGSA